MGTRRRRPGSSSAVRLLAAEAYIAVAGVDCDGWAAAIEVSAQVMSRAVVGTESVHGERQGALDFAIAGVHVEIGGE